MRRKTLATVLILVLLLSAAFGAGLLVGRHRQQQQLLAAVQDQLILLGPRSSHLRQVAEGGDPSSLRLVIRQLYTIEDTVRLARFGGLSRLPVQGGPGDFGDVAYLLQYGVGWNDLTFPALTAETVYSTGEAEMLLALADAYEAFTLQFYAGGSDSDIFYMGAESRILPQPHLINMLNQLRQEVREILYE